MTSLRRDLISRVQKELKQLQSLKPHGIKVTLPSDSLQVWEAVVPGSEESLYKGGRFKVQVYLPENYPLGPPTVRFLSPIYHLNVCPATGHVCLGFLSEETWLPTRCVQEVLSALFALLIRPEPEIAADQTLLNMYNQNRTVYEEKARKSAQEAK
ncbi:ubiquitin-conjugating enzyme E2-17 kDa-like isoform X1 [Orbicella faveolata]|uniref:ubiquitin-conjugating enzyme E2-17 kDa-like isoform X1 n=1 Tax=Orbicella faveolata TaxID=48498 RepID=UPI0009E59C5B|nr:ubiquitin-conjugating enzyme E2-17 kDa-like isoform X1 [Orbicella faveolata]